MPTLNVANRSVKVIETVTYEVTEAEPMTKLYGRTPFLPDSVIARYRDGELDEITVAGYRVLKGGSLSDLRLVDRYGGWQMDALPAWVRDQISQTVHV